MWSEFPIIQHSVSRGNNCAWTSILSERHFSWPGVGLDPEKSDVENCCTHSSSQVRLASPPPDCDLN